MSRRLNIERRRKRIRHYTARRRRRSPVHRAILFWWGTVLLLSLLGGALVQLLALRVFRMPEHREGKWVLPRATLSLIYASEADVAEALRMGNTRRSARAMSDADIGISFEMPLPEPQSVTLKPLPPLPTSFAAADATESPVASLPLMYAGVEKSATPSVMVRTTASLTAAAYAPRVRMPSEPGQCGTATFFVELDDEGRTVHVLRINPSGEETPRLKRLRTILIRTRGTKAATGTVTFTWNTKDLP